MYFLFTKDSHISVSKEVFFEHIELWEKIFSVVPVLTCSNELFFALCNHDDLFPLTYVGKCTDPDYLKPFQESMLD